MVAEMEGDMVADTKEKDNPKVEKGFLWPVIGRSPLFLNVRCCRRPANVEIRFCNHHHTYIIISPAPCSLHRQWEQNATMDMDSSCVARL